MCLYSFGWGRRYRSTSTASANSRFKIAIYFVVSLCGVHTYASALSPRRLVSDDFKTRIQNLKPVKKYQVEAELPFESQEIAKLDFAGGAEAAGAALGITELDDFFELGLKYRGNY